MRFKNSQRISLTRFVESDLFWVAYALAFALIITIGNLCVF
ncbi:hypothetical protein J2782_002850 [Brucella pseudogrignonensis]|uniref:Uncharacterized protein n=1 Tax=Brucella pseudogrignonensis TaxID=419475 RepID=A0ABU1MAR4_9HYPH|nr:hypothetical protein [Brucella pseudogrignonensis]